MFTCAFTVTLMLVQKIITVDEADMQVCHFMVEKCDKARAMNKEVFLATLIYTDENTDIKMYHLLQNALHFYCKVLEI